ncbi:hypothetical protein ACFQ36_03365 [Arthrobacter sp. GCM10027362]|uniref:hypothetical protein n=1 Tax=Arthrobacter sp. GCM10027362 TaxID=3273379 RepID=UPI003630FFFA
MTPGLAVSIGGLATPVIGTIADHTSLQVALMPLIVPPAIGGLLLQSLQEPKKPGTSPKRLTQDAAASRTAP